MNTTASMNSAAMNINMDTGDNTITNATESTPAATVAEVKADPDAISSASGTAAGDADANRDETIVDASATTIVTNKKTSNNETETSKDTDTSNVNDEASNDSSSIVLSSSVKIETGTDTTSTATDTDSTTNGTTTSLEVEADANTDAGVNVNVNACTRCASSANSSSSTSSSNGNDSSTSTSVTSSVSASTPLQQQQQHQQLPKEEEVAAASSTTTTTTTTEAAPDSVVSTNNSNDANINSNNNNDPFSELRDIIAHGLTEIPHLQRIRIEEEVHGVRVVNGAANIDIATGVSTSSTVGTTNANAKADNTDSQIQREQQEDDFQKALFLKRFQDELDRVLLLANNNNNTSSSSSTTTTTTTANNHNASTSTLSTAATTATPEQVALVLSSSPSCVHINDNDNDDDCNNYYTAAYRLCISKNYTYANPNHHHTVQLRLMCLRADFWDVPKACRRYLKHLTALHKYYGERYGLNYTSISSSSNNTNTNTLTIDCLDKEQQHVYEQGREQQQQYGAATVTSNGYGYSTGCNNSTTKTKKKNSGNATTATTAVTSTTTNSRGVYNKEKGKDKKGNGLSHSSNSSKRKGSLDSLPDMLALKSGSIQVLPSRDRSGRKVVVLQPNTGTTTTANNNTGSNGQQAAQTQRQVQHSKFKAMFYFLWTLARDDVDAQRRGFVLIINASKIQDKQQQQQQQQPTHGNNDSNNEHDYPFDLLEQYQELVHSIPIRFSAIHLAFDGSKDNGNDDSISNQHSSSCNSNNVPHKICRNILQAYVENHNQNIARIKLYGRDASNDATKSQLAPYGIPTHQIPVTHTGTIKLKEHNAWVRIQEWSDNKYNTVNVNGNGSSSSNTISTTCSINNNSQFTIIECPGTNDVLFSQGGKYWNGVNRFQRGNLEFMEFLETKIDVYQSTLSWKKKHSILLDCVSEFAASPQSTGNTNNYAPRFLETATQIEGVTAPDGCWVELPLASPLLMQKIRQTLLNHIRRLEASGKRKPAPSKAVRAKKNSKSNSKNTTSSGKNKTKKQQQSDSNKEQQHQIRVRAANKKRKLVHDSTTTTGFNTNVSVNVMKNNKLAMTIFGNGTEGNSNSIANNVNYGSNFQHDASLLTNKQQQQPSICEFLAQVERIAVSTTAVDIACQQYENNQGEETNTTNGNSNSYNNNANCSDMSSFHQHPLHHYHHNNNQDSLHDAIANDEKLVQAIIANDDRLNQEVGELFEMDSFLRDDEDDCERDDIADCLMGCML